MRIGARKLGACVLGSMLGMWSCGGDDDAASSSPSTSTGSATIATGSEEAGSSSSGGDTSTTSADSSSGAQTESGESGSSSSDATTSGSETGTTGNDGSTSDGSSSESSTGDAPACMVELPPPAECEDPGGGGAGGPGIECDIFMQDCPVGEKCMPWADDFGSSWNATRCTVLADDPVDVGGACTVEASGVSGIDDCVQGSMCWNVDTETLMGTCIEMCSCSAETPVCATAGTSCVISNEDVLALCLGVCNPLDPLACADGEACYPVGAAFHCAPDASGGDGQPQDACGFINVCDPGSFCANGSEVPGCVGTGCCSSFCELGDDDACLPGQACLPWYGDEAAPDECLGEVGACQYP